jgi:hypothetical protein
MSVCDGVDGTCKACIPNGHVFCSENSDCCSGFCVIRELLRVAADRIHPDASRDYHHVEHASVVGRPVDRIVAAESIGSDLPRVVRSRAHPRPTSSKPCMARFGGRTFDGNDAGRSARFS